MQKQDNTELLVWNSGAHLFAIELAECREIIQDPQVTEVPNSDPAVAGIANIRGAVLGVYDLPALLCYEQERASAGNFVIRVKKSGGDFCLTADEIFDAVSLETKDIRRIPGNFSETENRFIKSLAVLPGRVALMVRSGAFNFGSN